MDFLKKKHWIDVVFDRYYTNIPVPKTYLDKLVAANARHRKLCSDCKRKGGFLAKNEKYLGKKIQINMVSGLEIYRKNSYD